MKMQIASHGAVMFVGDRVEITNATCTNMMGYWVQKFQKDYRPGGAQIAVMDDFGNLRNVVMAAHQRHHFRQVLH